MRRALASQVQHARACAVRDLPRQVANNTHATWNARVLQAGQQTKQTEADEGHAPAALPHIAGYNEENPEHSPGPARGAEEPPPPGMGDSPTILLMDELAAARPPRKPVAPLLASFDKLVNEAEQLLVVPPHPPGQRQGHTNCAAIRIPLNIAREAHSLGTEDVTHGHVA